MITHEQTETKGRFFVKSSDQLIAELTYSKAGTSKIIIDHTHVSDEFRGKDYARKLVFKAVEYAKSNNLDVLPLCPYAKAIIAKYKELQ